MGFSDGKINELQQKVDKLVEVVEKHAETNETVGRKKATVATKETNSISTFRETFQTDYFPAYYTVNIEYPNLKRDLCPYKVEDFFTTTLKGRPKKITSAGKNEFLVEVSSKDQAERVLKIDNVCGLKCTAKEHSFFNECKGMIYLYNTDIKDVESFKDGMKEEYSISNVIEA